MSSSNVRSDFHSWLNALTAPSVAGEHAASVDAQARFPSEAVDAFKKEGLLSAPLPVSAGGIGLTEPPVRFEELSWFGGDKPRAIVRSFADGKLTGIAFTRGLSRDLLLTHLGHLAGQGVRRIFLEVEENNQPARRLYEWAGFGVVGRRERYYQQPGGEQLNALLMRRDLS